MLVKILRKKKFFFEKNSEVKTIHIRNKIDLAKEKPTVIQSGQNYTISLSAKTGAGIDLLREEIKACAGFQTTSGNVFSARQRHIEALTCAKKFLYIGKEQLENKKAAGELLAEDLRQAQLALNEITGEVTSDDLLGKIFSSFCIGK